MKIREDTISVSEQVQTFLESGLGMVVGTHDSSLIPEITRAWGPRVASNRKSISVCVSLVSGRKTAQNLQENGQIAFTFGSPVDYKQIQVKGRCLEIVAPDADDLAAVVRHREEFARRCETVGTPRRFIEGLFRYDAGDPPHLVKIRFAPEQMFNQTPGPGAGAPL